jgi:protein SCO1/2
MARRSPPVDGRALATSLALLVLVPISGRAQLTEEQPAALEGVGITERLDSPLPLDAVFRDEDGAEVALGEFFDEERPVILSLVYFDCPMLCILLLDGIVATISELDWTPGVEYEMVTVSFDARDTPDAAKAERDHYVQRLGMPEAAAGWHFLTGTEESIERLTEAVGFRYRYDPERNEFMHTAALYVTTDQGRLSRYLYGVAFEPETLRLALVEASAGRIGSPVDQFLLFCYAYDHTEGRYGPAAVKIMRLGGAAAVVALVVLFAWLGRRGARRKQGLSMGARS